MPLVQLIVLALVQGVTEFLPISSSAHLILAPLLVESWADQGPLIDIAGHVGTLFAVLLYFRAETAMLWRGALDILRNRASADRRLLLIIAVASLPALVFGFVLAVTGAIDALRSPYVLGAASIIFGVLLWHSDRSPSAQEGLERITWREAMTIGVAQMAAIIPGASRSGVTMTAARYLGWSRTEAARFSMLLAIPTIAALGLFATVKMVSDGVEATMAAAGVMAVLSFLVAYATIAVFIRLTRSVSFTPFVIYRLIFGVVLLLFANQLAA